MKCYCKARSIAFAQYILLNFPKNISSGSVGKTYIEDCLILYKGGIYNESWLGNVF